MPEPDILRLKIRCKACSKKFLGTIAQIGTHMECPRCKARPFIYDTIGYPTLSQSSMNEAMPETRKLKLQRANLSHPTASPTNALPIRPVLAGLTAWVLVIVVGIVGTVAFPVLGILAIIYRMDVLQVYAIGGAIWFFIDLTSVASLKKQAEAVAGRPISFWQMTASLIARSVTWPYFILRMLLGG